MMRLQKFLSQAGVASRRQSEELITEGKIKVNDEVVTKLGTVVDENDDEVKYNDKIVKLATQKIYIALNKPTGYISSASDSQGNSVLDLVKVKTRIYPVGRLDKESSGLIILTNDGEFTNLATHPRYGCHKEYFVVLDQDFKLEDIKKFESGLMLEGKKLQPVKVLMAKNKSCKIVLREGINRQIRRMFGQLGYTVIKLKRIKIGNLELGNLAEGKWQKITKEQVIE
ncbi:MAG: pseudouridine synthase [Candidatus Buchananbacteria bacterium]